MKQKQKILIIGNKPYYNLNLTNIIDSFDVIYRFNLCRFDKNSGTRYGKLAMCNHVYENFVKKKPPKSK